MMWLPRTIAAVPLFIAVSSCAMPTLDEIFRSVKLGNEAASDTATFTTAIIIDYSAPGHVARPAIAGSNMQWVDGGDGLIAQWSTGGIQSGQPGSRPEGVTDLAPGLAAVNARMLEAIKGIRPGSLRYPGGTNADVYHWRAGVGPFSTRGDGEHVFRKQRQKLLFGTGEFLALARQVGAEPVLTVNIPTGTAEEAAGWVRAVNSPGRNSDVVNADRGSSSSLVPVRFWELGNEPYLREDLRPELTLGISGYIKKAAETALAMKAADPSIQLGVPLRLDRLGTLPLVHFPGFAEAVLRARTLPIDFVALHNGYLPLLYKGGAGGTSPDRAILFRALMAASGVVESDLAAVRQAWRRWRPDTPLRMAVTEFNGMFTIGGSLDRYTSSFASALFMADVLRVLASSPDVILANSWSLNGNGVFGALTSDGDARPAAAVLRAWRNVLSGRVIPLSLTTSAFSSPAMGVVPASTDIPMVTAFAVRDTTSDSSRLVIINKSLTSQTSTEIRSSRGTVSGVVSAVTMTGSPDPFAIEWERDAPWQAVDVRGDGTTVRLLLPPSSMTVVTIAPLYRGLGFNEISGARPVDQR